MDPLSRVTRPLRLKHYFKDILLTPGLICSGLMCKSDEAKAVFVEAGGLTALLRVARASKSLKVTAAVCTALLNLSSYVPIQVGKINGLNGFRTILCWPACKYDLGFHHHGMTVNLGISSLFYPTGSDSVIRPFC